LAGLLRGSGFEPLPAAGTYFQLVDYGAISQDGDMQFSERLVHEAKVAVIPLSPFYAQAPRMKLVRLCIAKRDETLRTAADRLRAFAANR
jgi:methionine aminotransferase